MSDLKQEDFQALLDKDLIKVPQVGDTVTGTVLSASKAEVRLDIDGILTGIIRGQELFEEGDGYSNLKVGDEVEATVIDEENENGELELSFRFAGQDSNESIVARFSLGIFLFIVLCFNGVNIPRPNSCTKKNIISGMIPN